jgi:type I restriction enzyme S subunit
MVNDWEEVTLGDTLTLQRGFDLSKANRVEGHIPIVASNGIVDWHDEFKVKAPGVVIGRSGSIGGGQYIEEDFWPLNTTLWVKDFKGNNERFCYYLLLNIDFQMFNVGSGVPTLNRNHIHPLPISLPPVTEQKAIAHTLGSLDDKIELNRQMNETLEAMAQALFKSWFVDFDPVIDNALAAGNAIPDEFSERAEQRKTIEKKDYSDIQGLFPDEFQFTEEMGWVPKGWRVRNLSEMVSIIIDHRGKTPKKLGGDWAESGYPAISAKNIKGNKLVRPDTIRFVDKDIYDKWMKVPLEVGDVIMTSEAPLGELYYLNSKINYLLSQRLYAIRADKVNCTGSYLFYWFQTEFGSAEIQNRATGTTVFGIKQSELRKVLVLCPPSSVLEKFDTYSQGLLRKMDANDLSITELAKFRDTLLPKLMSGELRISDAAELVDEVL